MPTLFKSAIYVNAGSDRLQDASRGNKPSKPITENKRWIKGQKLLAQARARKEELPLIFTHLYAQLTFWALTRKIILHDFTTEYQFADLRPLSGYRRSDLVVESTGAPLPDRFIRSYALVRTPDFLFAQAAAESVALDGFIPGSAELPETATPPGRAPSTVSRILRDTILVASLKRKYDFQCQLCATRLELPRGFYYCEAHHIRPLGEPHGGPNTESNLVIVCPNHHVLLDYGSIPLSTDSFRLVRHRIKQAHIDYHNTKIHNVA